MSTTPKELQEDIQFAKAQLRRGFLRRLFYIGAFYSAAGFGLAWKAGAPKAAILDLGIGILASGYTFSAALFLLGSIAAALAGQRRGASEFVDYRPSMADLMLTSIRTSTVAGGSSVSILLRSCYPCCPPYRQLPTWQIYILCVAACGSAGMSVGGFVGLIGIWSAARSRIIAT